LSDGTLYELSNEGVVVMKVTKEKYGKKATLKFKDEDGVGLGISCDEYWEMCLALYEKLTYVNDTDIIVHTTGKIPSRHFQYRSGVQ